jgi:UDP-N-acetylmuramoylalanine--D-glutamate ligase
MPDNERRKLGDELAGKRIAVLGAGVSGVSLARLARDLGADVFLSDAGTISEGARDVLDAIGVPSESGGHSDRVLRCDEVLVGSGFPPSSAIVSRALEKGVSLKGELDFVTPYLRGKLIGVTGSNGKTTTASLTGYLLQSAGRETAVAGNIGSPLADMAGRDREFIVAELSSFQLHWATAIALDGAVVTNLAPDHIDWHGSYENYARAKAKILSFLREGGFGIVQKRDLRALACEGEAMYPLSWDGEDAEKSVVLRGEERCARLSGRELFRFEDTNLLGSHNMENAAMAMAVVCLLGADTAAARRGLASYVPPPHRCALVAVYGGVRYIDDSKGTNIAAAAAAMSSIEGKKVVILGGKGKGEDYAALLDPLRTQARWAVLIGEEADKIASALDDGAYREYSRASGMEEAVRLASERAYDGDAVLLSPACTSWDMYENYGERGDHFVRVVKKMTDAACDEHDGS